MGKNVSTANIRSWFEQFLVAKQAAGLSPATLRWYRARLGEYLNWIDEHNYLGPLDAIALENFLAQRRRQVSPHTVQAYYRTLGTFTRWLIKRHYITANESPIAVVDKPQIPMKRMKFVSKVEFDRLYGSIHGTSWTAHRDRLLFTILFYSGLRAGEVLSLQIDDIDRIAGVLVVRSGKGNKDRVVPYAPNVPDLLDVYLGSRPLDAQALWVSNNGIGGVRGVLEYDGLKEMLRRRCRAAGLPRLRLHALRHGFAMWALNSGVQLSALSAMMGHSSTTVTESIYARWVTTSLRREYNAAFNQLHESAD